MNVLEIIWILLTLLNVWLIIRVIVEDSGEGAFPFILLVIVNLILMVVHWWEFLTTPLWG